MFDLKKHTAGPIEENMNSVVVFKCSAHILKWMVLKLRRICALVCRKTQIEVRVLLKGDASMVLVTAKIPKDLRKGRTGTKLL